MGSCKNTGSISEKTAGPFRTTGRIFCSNDGPILGFWQHLGRIGGPLRDHRQVLSAARWAYASALAASWDEQWAHSLPSVVFLAATIGSCKDTRSISVKAAEPSVEFSAEMMDPS